MGQRIGIEKQFSTFFNPLELYAFKLINSFYQSWHVFLRVTHRKTVTLKRRVFCTLGPFYRFQQCFCVETKIKSENETLQDKLSNNADINNQISNCLL